MKLPKFLYELYNLPPLHAQLSKFPHPTSTPSIKRALFIELHCAVFLCNLFTLFVVLLSRSEMLNEAYLGHVLSVHYGT